MEVKDPHNSFLIICGRPLSFLENAHAEVNCQGEKRLGREEIGRVLTICPDDKLGPPHALLFARKFKRLTVHILYLWQFP